MVLTPQNEENTPIEEDISFEDASHLQNVMQEEMSLENILKLQELRTNTSDSVRVILDQNDDLEHQIRLLLSIVNSLESEIKSLENSALDSSIESEVINGQKTVIEMKKQTADRYKDVIAQNEKSIRHQRDKVALLLEEIGNLKSDIEDNLTEISDLKSHIDSHKRNQGAIISSAKKDIQEAEFQADRLSDSNVKLNKRLNELLSGKAIQGLMESNKDLLSKIDELKRKHIEEITKLNIENQRLKRNLNQTQEELDTYLSENGVSQKEDQTQQEADKLSEIVKIQAQKLEKSELEISQHKATNVELSQQNIQLTERNNQLNQQIESAAGYFKYANKIKCYEMISDFVARHAISEKELEDKIKATSFQSAKELDYQALSFHINEFGRGDDIELTQTFLKYAEEYLYPSDKTNEYKKIAGGAEIHHLKVDENA